MIMSNNVAIHEVFKTAVENLNKYDTYCKSIISKNISNLNWIDEHMDKVGREVSEAVILGMAESINAHQGVVDIMSYSAMVYKGQQRGFNVEPLIEAMNIHGAWLMQQQIKESPTPNPLFNKFLFNN